MAKEIQTLGVEEKTAAEGCFKYMKESNSTNIDNSADVIDLSSSDDEDDISFCDESEDDMQINYGNHVNSAALAYPTKQIPQHVANHDMHVGHYEPKLEALMNSSFDTITRKTSIDVTKMAEYGIFNISDDLMSDDFSDHLIDSVEFYDDLMDMKDPDYFLPAND